MNQQINLFQPIFRKEKKLLSFEALLQISGIVLVALIILHSLEQWQHKGLQTTLSTLQAQQGQRLSLLEELAQKYNQSGQDTPQAQLAKIKEELQAQQYLMGKLSQTHGASSGGFSQYMEGFARQVINGMWLTGFRITDGGNELIIQGSSLEPTLIPGFLERLTQEDALTGTQFNLLQIQREATSQKQIDFTLYTDPEMEFESVKTGANQ